MRGRSREGGERQTQCEELFFPMRNADESSPSTADVSNGIIFPHGVIANLMRERDRVKEVKTETERDSETEKGRNHTSK
jgi:hypothetical protein